MNFTNTKNFDTKIFKLRINFINLSIVQKYMSNKIMYF